MAEPVMLAFNIVSNLFGVGTASMMSRSLGTRDYKKVKQCSAFGCLLNIVLDPIFVFPWGLNMGAEGAGCATFLSNCASCLFYFGVLYIKRRKLYASISPKNFTLKRDVVFGVCSIGIPAAIQTLLNVASMTVLNNFTYSYGAAAVAAMGIVQKINSVPVNVALGDS